MNDPIVITLSSILPTIEPAGLIADIEAGFVAYSKGLTVVPPVGELSFENPPGDVHIKYGYLLNDEVYVIKIASSFYENQKLGINTNEGLMLCFSQKTGELQAILLDRSHLTDIRTAVAGHVAAKYFAPQKIDGIGIYGTGVQARLQLKYLQSLTDCRNVWVWGRSWQSLERYQAEMKTAGWDIHLTQNRAEPAEHCNLLVTTTPSKEPLLLRSHLRPGTHITAIGSDTLDKQELDERIVLTADKVVCDSRKQCLDRGEISQAIRKVGFAMDLVTELGEVICKVAPGRERDDEITVADLTGLAIQDVQIVKHVLQRYHDNIRTIR